MRAERRQANGIAADGAAIQMATRGGALSGDRAQHQPLEFSEHVRRGQDNPRQDGEDHEDDVVDQVPARTRNSPIEIAGPRQSEGRRGEGLKSTTDLGIT